MPTGVTDRGVAYFQCAKCGRVEVFDNERQAEAAEALHMLSHRGDDNAK